MDFELHVRVYAPNFLRHVKFPLSTEKLALGLPGLPETLLNPQATVLLMPQARPPSFITITGHARSMGEKEGLGPRQAGTQQKQQSALPALAPGLLHLDRVREADAVLS